MTSHFLGIDIQTKRNCSYAVINDNNVLIDSGWFNDPETDSLDLIQKGSGSVKFYVGIDAPRMPLRSKREWYWNGGKKRWAKRGTQKGNGRHCEVVIKAHNIANPQWTPIETEAPDWMKLGFSLFSVLEKHATVYEVFPSASYTLLQGNMDVRLDVDFSGCKPGPKDMLDAWVAAVTVREFVEGRGAQIGGGDGMGTIIIPRPIPDPAIDEVLKWPKM